MKTHQTNQTKSIVSIVVTLLVAMLATPAFAALTVSPIFRSNMVLQRGTTVPVFGTADPGAAVTVSFGSQNKSANANGSGVWQVNLSSMSASSSPGTMTVTSGSDVVTFTGVQVGEVWLCSGQSNMGKPLSFANDSAPYIADAANHNIRLFRMIAGNPPGGSAWTVSDSTTADDFSAVGYWHGLELSKWFGGSIPVGLIQATHDGTSIANWEHSNGGTGVDYDAMVNAIQPFAIKGVIWYQGESDAGDAPDVYQQKLTDMINEWRSDWGLPTLPFGIVQLAGTAGSSSSGGARLGQLHTTLAVPHTWLAVSSDLPGGNQLPPRDKYPIGIRLALGARATVYGDNIEYSGPIRAAAPASYVSGNTIILNFSHLGNGLTTSDGQPPGPFAIAPASGNFSSANAMIVGNTIQVSSSQVSAPTRVKYQFGGTGNLFNSVSIPTEGGTKMVTMLPASMFLIDVAGGGDTTPPAAPTGLAATGGNGLVSLDWNDNGEPDLAGYNVKRSTSSGGPYSTIATGVASSAYADNTVNNGTTYHYVVSAVDTASNESANSGQASATPSGGGGCTPTYLSVSAIVPGTWNAGQGNKGGAVQVTIVNNCGNPVSGATVSGTFTGDFNETRSGVSDTSGVATINTAGVKKGTITFTFCVNTVSGTLTYNPGANAETCDGL